MALVVLLALSVALASPARADDPWSALKKTEPTQSGEGWSGLWDGKTLSSGQGMLSAEVGFPGAGVGAHFGLARGIDVGGRAMFSFLPTNRITGTVTGAFGLGATAPIRIGLMRSRAADIALRVEPGVWLPTFTPAVGFGIYGRVAVTGGVSVVPGGTIFGFLDAPLFFQFVPTGGSSTRLPVFLGVGYEHHFGELFGLGGRAMIGPDIMLESYSSNALVTNTQLGLGAEVFFLFRWDRLPHREAPQEETDPWGGKPRPSPPLDEKQEQKKDDKLW
jgi:hypothetical protein